MRRVDHTRRTEFVASVRRAFVVGKQVGVAEGCTTVLRSTAGMDQDRLPGLVGLCVVIWRYAGQLLEQMRHFCCSAALVGHQG